MDISFFFYKGVSDADESCYLKISSFAPGAIQLDCWGDAGPDEAPDWSCVLNQWQTTELIDALTLVKKSVANGV